MKPWPTPFHEFNANPTLLALSMDLIRPHPPLAVNLLWYLFFVFVDPI